MTQKTNVDATVSEIKHLFETYGNEDYDGEPVSQSSHMIQCAMQAIKEHAGTELILGAFLHDIGHLLRHQQQTEAMGSFGVVNHEGIGGDYLQSKGFSERVCAVVANHVNAKRYLVATNADYKAKLSLASLETLKWQGGPMTEKEEADFRKNVFFDDIIRVRLWDEMAKDAHAETLPLSYFINLIQKYLSINQHDNILTNSN